MIRTFNNFKEFEFARDILAKERDYKKRILEDIYCDKMQLLFESLHSLQNNCKHENEVVTTNETGGSRKCPDCGRWSGWGYTKPESPEVKEKFNRDKIEMERFLNER